MTRARLQSATALAAVLAVTSLATHWRAAMGAPGIDFYQYRLVGRVLLHPPAGAEPIDVYAPDAGPALAEGARREVLAGRSPREIAAARRRSSIEVFASPLLFVLFGLLAGGAYDASLVGFQLVSLCAGALALWLLARVAELRGALALLCIAFFASAYEPFQYDAAVGNVNRLLLLALAGAATLAGGRAGSGQRVSTTGESSEGPAAMRAVREAAAGGVLGLAAGFKPVVAPALALFLWSALVDRRLRVFAWRLGGAAVTAAAAIALPVLLSGRADLWGRWLSAVERLGTAFPVPAADGNLALLQLWQELADGPLSGAAATAWAVGLALAAAAALWLGARRAARDRDADALLVLGLGCVVTLLGARLAWSHYFVLAIPLILWHWRSPPVESQPPDPMRARQRWVGAVAAVLLSLAPAHVLALGSAHAVSLCANLGIALLLVSALHGVLRGSSPADVPAPVA